MKRTLVVMAMACLLSGCGGLLNTRSSLIIPTGDPVTSVLVGALVQEGATYVAQAVVPAVLDGVLSIPRYFTRRSGPRYKVINGLTFDTWAWN